MPNHIREQVKEFLATAEATPETVQMYLDFAIQERRDVAMDMRRLFLLAFVTAASFEVFVRGVIRELDFLGMKIVETKVVSIFIPPIVLLLLLRLAIVNLRRLAIYLAIDQIMLSRYPELHKSKLPSIIVPQALAIVPLDFVESIKGYFSKFLMVMGYGEILIYWIVPPVFIIYSYFRLFLLVGGTWMVWMSSGISIIFLIIWVIFTISPGDVLG